MYHQHQHFFAQIIQLTFIPSTLAMSHMSSTSMSMFKAIALNLLYHLLHLSTYSLPTSVFVSILPTATLSCSSSASSTSMLTSSSMSTWHYFTSSKLAVLNQGNFVPRRHLATSRNISDCHNCWQEKRAPGI